MAIRVIKNKHEPTISLVFAGAREIKFAGMCIHAIPCTNFEFKTMLTEKEIAKAKKEDDPEDTSDGKKRQPKVVGNERKNGNSAVEKAFSKNIDAALKQA